VAHQGQFKNYRVIRSDRKTVSIEVTREREILVRAPRRLSDREIDGIVEKHGAWIKARLEKAESAGENGAEPDEAGREKYVQRARAYLPGRVAYYGGLMGLSPSGITITGAAARFGSCSPKNRLCFSWRLMRYPDEAIDCVVVHELAHIVHKNHGKDFYALIASVMPDYRLRKKLLKAAVR